MRNAASTLPSINACPASSPPRSISVVAPPGSIPLAFNRIRARACAPLPSRPIAIRFPVQPGNPVHGHGTPVKYREWFMENAAEGNQLFQRNSGRHTTLHKSYVNAIRRIVQLLEVLQRPFRWQDPEFHVVSRQNLPVLFGGSLEDAAGWAGDDRDGAGGCGSHIPIGRHDHSCGDQNQGCRRYQKIAEGNLGEPGQGSKRSNNIIFLFGHH